MNKIICGDALIELDKLKAESVDLIILDPNYQDWDKLVSEGLLVSSLCALKDTGNIICFTKQPFDYNLRLAVSPVFRREMIWSFTNGGAWVSKKMPLVSFQKMFWLVRSENFYIDVRTGNDYKKGTKSMKRKTKVFEGYCEEGKQFTPSDEGTWIRDHYHFNKPHTGSLPSKPEELISILIKCFSPEGGVVLDPFAGSGIVLKVAQKLNRQYIGIEIDKNKVKNIKGVLSKGSS